MTVNGLVDGSRRSSTIICFLAIIPGPLSESLAYNRRVQNTYHFHPTNSLYIFSHNKGCVIDSTKQQPYWRQQLRTGCEVRDGKEQLVKNVFSSPFFCSSFVSGYVPCALGLISNPRTCLYRSLGFER